MDGTDVDIHDAMNPAGMFRDGQRQREHSAKDILPTSARLIPEFSGRRSIKDMFFAKPKPAGAGVAGAAAAGSHAKPETTASETNAPETSTPAAIPSETRPRDDADAAETEDVAPLWKTVSASKTSERAVKRSKPNASASSTAQGAGKGQKSLKGFFQPKTISPSQSALSETTTLASVSSAALGPQSPSQHRPSSQSQPPPETSTPSKKQKLANGSSAASSTGKTPSHQPTPLPPDPDSDSDPVFDPEATREGWSRLFTKPAAPLCESHREPCKTMTTRKPGVNCGRAFWMCARPLGPSGQKESGTRWRCGTFIWGSEWAAPG
jgi:AP endonuclease 2